MKRSFRAIWLTWVRPTNKRVLHGPKVIVIPITPTPPKVETQDNPPPAQRSRMSRRIKKIRTFFHIKVNKS